MKLLFFGGTRFLGLHLVTAALSVTTKSRSNDEESLLLQAGAVKVVSSDDTSINWQSMSAVGRWVAVFSIPLLLLMVTKDMSSQIDYLLAKSYREAAIGVAPPTYAA